MSVEKKESVFVNLDEFTRFSNKGRLTLSTRNDYPRFTWFHKEEKGFISAPMRPSNLIAVARILLDVVDSKVDRKYTVKFFNTDYETKEKVLQSIMVIARRDRKIIIGLRAAENLPLNMIIFEESAWVKIYEDDSEHDMSGMLDAREYAEELLAKGRELKRNFLINSLKEIYKAKVDKSEESKTYKTLENINNGDVDNYSEYDDHTL